MEVVFLKRENLEVLDFGYVDHDYQIVIDSVIPQKSTFTVNKKSINADAGDLLVVKDKAVNYIGIIIGFEEDTQKYTTKVQTTDFISILDVQVKLKSFTGNISLGDYRGRVCICTSLFHNDQRSGYSEELCIAGGNQHKGYRRRRCSYKCERRHQVGSYRFCIGYEH